MWRIFTACLTVVATGLRRANLPDFALCICRSNGSSAVILFLIPCVLSLVVSPGWSQNNVSVRGRVTDSQDGQQLVAFVSLLETGQQSYSEPSGQFRFESVPPGTYGISVKADGYQPWHGAVTVSEGFPTVLDILLDRRLIPVSAMVVTGDVSSVRSAGVRVLLREDFIDRGHSDLADVLDGVDGLQLEQGSSHGPVTIRIRGADSRHVLVLVNGQQLNGGSDEGVDINSVPMAQISRVEIRKGGASSEFGDGALGGVINIITYPSADNMPGEFSLRQTHGSWGSYITELSTSHYLDRLMTSIQFSGRSGGSRGDFPFRYTVQPTDTTITGRRINADQETDNYAITTTTQFSSRSRLALAGQIYESRHGVPGPASAQNAHATRQDDRVLATAEWEYRLSDRWRLQTRLGHSRNHQEFSDYRSAGSLRHHTRFANRLTSLAATSVFYLWTGSQMWLVLSSQYERLDHQDVLQPRSSTGLTKRRSRSASLALKQELSLPSLAGFQTALVDVTLRHDRSTSEPASTTRMFPWQPLRQNIVTDHLSPAVSVVFSRRGRLAWSFSASHGKSFNLPSLTALFWKGDVRSSGNPDLRPETVLHSEGGLQLRFDGGGFDLNGGLTLFHQRFTDLVVWVQSGPGGVWKPVNLGRSRVVGHEESVELTLLGGHLQMRYRNAVTHSTNQVPGHTSLGRELTFTPHYLSSLGVQLQFWSVQMEYTARRVGRRYANEANTKWYAAYLIHDIELQVNWNISDRWGLRWDGSLRNLGDEAYALIVQHPMPGRSYDFRVGITWRELGP